MLVDVEHLLPGFTAIGGHKHAAFGVGTEGAAQRGNPDGVRVARVDNNSGNLACLAQSQIFPGFAPVARAVDACPHRNAVAGVAFTCAHPYDFGVLRVQGNIANRLGLLLVEQGRPRDAAVGGFPESARCGAHIDH